MSHDIFLPDDKQNIAASETKFSPTIDTERLEKITVTVFANQTGSIYVDGKNDNKPETTYRNIDIIAYAASVGAQVEITPSFRWMRIRFVNDATLTTTHEVTYRLTPKKAYIMATVKQVK